MWEFLLPKKEEEVNLLYVLKNHFSIFKNLR